MKLANYLFFTTRCEEALAFYAECGLGRITELTRHGAHGMPVVAESMKGRVMHARFEGPGILFFASDNHDAEPMRGSAHMLMMDDGDNTDGLFARLAAGGTVTTPLTVQPWGSYYGKLTDRFGVQWMLNCSRQHGAA
jgi:PhnB protein